MKILCKPFFLVNINLGWGRNPVNSAHSKIKFVFYFLFFLSLLAVILFTSTISGAIKTVWFLTDLFLELNIPSSFGLWLCCQWASCCQEVGTSSRTHSCGSFVWLSICFSERWGRYLRRELLELPRWDYRILPPEVNWEMPMLASRFLSLCLSLSPSFPHP